MPARDRHLAYQAVTVLLALAASAGGARAASPPKAPASVSPPVVTGSAFVGRSLVTSDGTWSGTVTGYKYAWQQCGATGNACGTIAGATANTYVVRSTDVGHALRSVVTAANGVHTASATSAATAAANTLYTNTAAPTISGSAAVGTPLTVSTGSWSPSPATYGYAWLRCDSGGTCAPIVGDSVAQYTPMPGDVGDTIVARTAPNGDFGQAVTSASTGVIGSLGAPPAGYPVAGIGSWRIATHDFDLGESILQTGRYSVVAFGWQHDMIPLIRREDTATRLMIYEAGPDVGSCNTVESLTCGTGVSKEDAAAYDPSWLLRDSSGRLLYNAGYANNSIGDIGSSTFQQEWAKNAINSARAWGFDGVTIDDILGDFNGYTNATPAKYPTVASWQNAMVAFVASVSAQFRAAGLALYLDVQLYWGGTNDASNDVKWWQRIAPYADALMCEYFEQNPNTLTQMYSNTHTEWTGFWDGWLKLIDVAQAAGADFWGIDYASGDAAADRRNMVYGKASFLLKWDGGDGAYFFDPPGADPWNPAWTTDIGRPSGAMYAVGSGAYRRDYGQGTVVVNPMPSTQTIALGAAYVDTATGQSTTSVTLASTSAAILHTP